MTKRITYTIAAVVAFILCLITLAVNSGTGGKAYAATSAYSGVVTDLSKDPYFNPSDYSNNINDTSINVIQIAESEDSELFIYIYQPSAAAYNMTLRTIRFSTSYEGDFWKDYNLTLLSNSGVFFKYKVEGFNVSKASTRYYNITAVHRDYVRYVDDGKLSNEKAIAVEVAQLWTATTINNTVTYSMETVDVITITGCQYGSIRVPSGFNFNTSYACDMHIIAFNTNIRIDKLLEADVAFDYRTVDKGLYDKDYGEWQSKTVTVTYEEKGSSNDHLFGQGSRTWDRIQSSSEFLNTCKNFDIDLSDDVSGGIKQNKWVLAFWETGYQNDTGGVFGWVTWIGAVVGTSYKHYTQVSNATVLRLEFIKDGITYNLGVVSNKSGDFSVIAGGDETFLDEAKDAVSNFFKNTIKDIWNKTFGKLNWWQWLLVVVAIIIAIAVVVFVLIPSVRQALISWISSRSERKVQKKRRKSAKKRKGGK